MAGRPEKRHHDDDDTKIPSKKIKDWGETECAICRIDFKEEDKIRKLGCGHKFHGNCINMWLNARPIQEQRTCPTCLTEVTNDDDINHDTNMDTNDVLKQDDPIFFGAVVCLKNANGTKQIIQKYFNVDLDLGVDSTLGNLRTAVLNKLPERPSKINKMYFGTPATCDENPDLFQEIKPAQSGRTLIDVYKQYREKLNRAISNMRIAHENGTYQHKPSDDHIENLYFLHEINMDEQNIQTEYLYNPDNPDVPDEYIVHPSRIDESYPESVIYALQPIEVRRKSTDQRIAWIVFEVEHSGTPGGGSSTRKKRRTNKKKSRKHKK